MQRFTKQPNEEGLRSRCPQSEIAKPWKPKPGHFYENESERRERERQREGSVKPTRFLPSLTSCAGDAARHGLPEEMLHGGPKTGALLEGSVRDCKLLIGCACNNWSVSTCKQVFIVSSVWGSSQICYVLLVGILKIDSASGTLVPKVLVRVYIYTHMWHTSLCVGNRLYRGVITVLFYRIIPYYITYIEHTSYMYI